MAIKIELTVTECWKCPYKRTNTYGSRCVHPKGPKDKIKLDSIPSNCPFPKVIDYINLGVNI